MNAAAQRVPEDFLRALDSLRHTRLRPEIHLEEIPAPARIAPYGAALTGEFYLPSDPDEELASGRFIALYNPDGHDDWQGCFRIVTLIRAAVEHEMSSDPMLGEVAWSWVLESLREQTEGFTALSGTVSRVINQSFGEVAERPDTTDLEIRASWTPSSPDLSGDYLAWAALLGSCAGVPGLPDGVASLDQRR